MSTGSYARTTATPTFVTLCTLAAARPAPAQPAARGQPAGATAPTAAGPTSARSTAPDYHLPTVRERRRAYVADLLGPSAALRAVTLAGVDQWQDDPTGWRQGANGYSRRVLSRVGGVGAQITLEHGIAAGLRQDLRYQPLGHGPRGARVWHALTGAALAHRADGRRTRSAGTLAGAYGGRLAETAWQPGGASHGDAAAAVAFNLAARGIVNVVREFRR